MTIVGLLKIFVLVQTVSICNVCLVESKRTSCFSLHFKIVIRSREYKDINKVYTQYLLQLENVRALVCKFSARGEVNIRRQALVIVAGFGYPIVYTLTSNLA